MDYPWFGLVDDDTLEQGDILDSFPVFLPPEDLDPANPSSGFFEWDRRDVIVLSQSCDLVKGREKIDDVVVGLVWKRSELTTGHLATTRGMEDARRGIMPGVHLLGACTVLGHEQEVRIVDFRRLFALPLEFVRKAAAGGPRLRLLPPYREHLAQAFARFFMRVGLPIDIPPFK